MKLLAAAAILITVALPLSQRADIAADLACNTARMIVRHRNEVAPAPVSDKCINCDGTGILGDGKIKKTCGECGGTGKTPKSVLIKKPLECVICPVKK